MNSALISIIVPVYNVELYLQKCIDSILNQTYRNKEIIIVDDGSTDNSINIINEYEKKYKEIQVVRQKNMGVSVARNVGLNLSNGQYVTFIDADDYIEEHAIEDMVDKIVKEKSDMCVFGFNTILENNSRKHTKIYDFDEEICKDRIIALRMFFLFKIHGFPWNKICKRELYFDNNIIFPVNKSYGEDSVVTFKLLNCCKKISFLKKTLYNYSQRAGSITKLNKCKNADDILDNIMYMYNELEKNNDYYKIKNEYESYYIKNLYCAMIIIYKCKIYKSDNENIKKALENINKYIKKISLIKIIFNRRISIKDKIIAMLLQSGILYYLILTNELIIKKLKL